VKEVLCVDDDETVRTVFAQLLTSKGHNVSLAKNGAEALDCVNAVRFDVVITDSLTPQMTGLELVRHLRSIAYPGKIIVFSGGLSPKAVKAFEALKVDMIAWKPSGLGDILTLLQKP
jgi:CheY-like chemotaxis protein